MAKIFKGGGTTFPHRPYIRLANSCVDVPLTTKISVTLSTGLPLGPHEGEVLIGITKCMV